MKITFVSSVVAACLTFSASAAEVTLIHVHLCCDSCVKGVDKAVATVSGVTATSDKDAKTVSLSGADKEAIQKAADALVAAGYFGQSSDPKVKLDAASGAKGQKVQSLKVQGVHLCCAKCVKAVNEAVESVPGVKGTTATKGAKSFEVTGDFDDKSVFDALQKAGLTGKAE